MLVDRGVLVGVVILSVSGLCVVLLVISMLKWGLRLSISMTVHMLTYSVRLF